MRIIEHGQFKLPETIKNILLIQLGDIGDVVWTTPGIWAVKNAFPLGRVSVLVRSGFGDLLEADPSVVRVFEIKKQSGGIFKQAAGQLAFLKDLHAANFDLAVDLRLGDRGAFLALATGAPIRVTMHHPTGVPWWRSWLFTHGAIPADLPPERGAAEQSLRILRTLGIDTPDKIPRLWVSNTAKKRVREILRQEKADSLQQWITLNPFSRWSYKEWSDQKWIEIIDWLWQLFKIPTIIVGSPEEKAKAELLISQCRGQAYNFAGKTNLSELAGLLALSRLHIGVDSAAPHIAAAMGVPTITIYGPSSWFDWAPVGQNHRVILPDKDCAPCHQKGCNGSGHSLCLEELSPEKVKKVVLESMNSQCA